MRSFAALAAVGMLTLPVAACQNANQADTSKKLDDIDKRLGRIEAAIKAGGGAARPAGARGQAPRRARPPGPNPATTYSVSVKDSAWEGAEHAKVTVVEGFEFA